MWTSNRGRFSSIVPWLSWQYGNERLFQNTTHTVPRPIRMALSMMPNQNDQGWNNQKGNQSWQGDSRSRVSCQFVGVKILWYHPFIGVLKLNFDVSVSANGTSVAFVILDYRGRLIKAGGKLVQPYFVLFAELVAVWLGDK